MMIDKHIVLESLSRAVVAKVGSNHLRLSTHCLYPSNATVSVVIKGGLDEFIVSDDGGAIDEIASSGVRDRITDRQIRGMVKRQGLKVAAPEEVAFRMGWVSAAELEKLAQPLARTGYGKYLLALLKDPVLPGSRA